MRCGDLLDPGLSEDQRAQRMAALDRAQATDSHPPDLANLACTAAVQGDVPLATRLARNPTSPPEAVAAVAALLTLDEAVDHAWNAQSAHDGRDPALLALLIAHPRLAARPANTTNSPLAAMAAFEDVDVAARSLVGSWAGQVAGTPTASTEYRDALNALLTVAADPACAAADPYRALPWPYVRDFLIPGRCAHRAPWTTPPQSSAS